MHELDKALLLSLGGAKAEAALAAFHAQMESWNLKTPPPEPLLLDFGLGDFDRCGLIEYWIANEVKSGYCGKYLFVFGGQSCPRHSHRGKHETFFVLKGRVLMHYDGEEREMGEGDVLPVEPGKVHGFCGIGPALLLELSTPCLLEDNFFENPAITL